MELIAAMARSAREQPTSITDSGSVESGIQTTDKSHGTSEEKKPSEKTKLTQDSGEDSMGTSSLGRGRMMRLATERLREQQKSSEEEESSTSRGSGSREAMKRAMETIRQYHGSAEKTRSQMSALSLEEQAPEVPKDVVSYRGSKGSAVKVMTNYLPLKWRGNQRIYEYVVQFEPPIDSIHLRMKIIQQLQPQIGIFVSTGYNIFLTRKLEPISTYHTTLAATQDSIKVTIKLVKQKPEEELSPFLNNLFNKVMRALKFVRHKRKQFDPTKAKLGEYSLFFCCSVGKFCISQEITEEAQIYFTQCSYDIAFFLFKFIVIEGIFGNCKSSFLGYFAGNSEFVHSF